MEAKDDFLCILQILNPFIPMTNELVARNYAEDEREVSYLARSMTMNPKTEDDKSCVEYQLLTWDALRKSINGLVNKVNASNIKNIIPELFQENLIRGRGLFCLSVMKSQTSCPPLTDVFAALVPVVNTKFPDVGRLVLGRSILQLNRALMSNDKPRLLSAAKLIAHLVNQRVAHEIVALDLLTLLLERPSDDGVEVAVGFVMECGKMLNNVSPRGLHGVFQRLRGILHEGEIDKRVQFMIEGCLAIGSARFQGRLCIRSELDLVHQHYQLTHAISLNDDIDPESNLDVFNPDPDFIANEKRYEDVNKSILFHEEDSDEEEFKKEDNVANLRKTICLTIMSSVDFEETGHKLMKIIKHNGGQEMEICAMLLECCSQAKMYLSYYGLLGQRLCMIHRIYQETFEYCFAQQYAMIHRLETNKLRNVAMFFGHLLARDTLPWKCLAYIRLTEEDTTSSSRIFIKFLFMELAEQLGIHRLHQRLNNPAMQDSYESIFQRNNPNNTRFASNFFVAIGLGGITKTL